MGLSGYTPLPGVEEGALESEADVAEGNELVFVRSRACGDVNCVEAAAAPSGKIVLRTVTGAAVLASVVIERHEWEAFLEGVRCGDFDSV